jgi:hypothetical protein
MSIRPVEFNGMIQNTHGVTSEKTHEDNKSFLQQQNAQTEAAKEQQAAMTTVKHMEETQKQEYRYRDKKGNGGGYEGNRNKKKKKSEKESKDGQVIAKTDRVSFDIKI